MNTNEECAEFIKEQFALKKVDEKNSTVIGKLFSQCLKEKPDGTKGTDNMTCIIVKIKAVKDDTS